MLRFILFLLLFFVLSIFSYFNQGETVRLTSFGGMRLRPVPVYLLVVGAFFVGALFSALLTAVGWTKARRTGRRHQKQIERLEQELDHWRTDAIKKSPLPGLPIGQPFMRATGATGTAGAKGNLDDDPFDDE